jgi:hypothetical protein
MLSLLRIVLEFEWLGRAAQAGKPETAGIVEDVIRNRTEGTAKQSQRSSPAREEPPKRPNT